jgi:capsule biosynthesis phosphatase
MRIAIDIDGTLCHFRADGEGYGDVKPLPGAAERMRSLKEAGHELVLLTARHMKTCGGNVGLVVQRQGLVLLEWLERYGIPYDEIWFGKPHADVYIDDNGFRFKAWSQIEPDGSNLPAANEAEAQR